MLKYSISLLIHYLKFQDIPIPYRRARESLRGVVRPQVSKNHTLIQQRPLFKSVQILGLGSQFGHL
jgi:hypothetical protein